jgi:large subunit ribosomal protein L13
LRPFFQGPASQIVAKCFGGLWFERFGRALPVAGVLVMSTLSTAFVNSETARGDWYVVDASDKVLGRLATQIAMRLKGKTKASYSPHVDMGDHIVVLNAEKIKVTGNKLDDKIYWHHTGAIGGIKSIALGKLLKEHPERAIEFAVKGMLPKGPLGRKMYKKLHVFAGAKHPHAAQQPKQLEI